MPLDTATPAHQRLVDELLAWDAPRPVGDPGLRDALATALVDGLEPLGDVIPAGESVFLGKTSLGALVCDGRFLDYQDDDFTWSQPLVAGKLAHRAIELDHGNGREPDPDEIVEHVWQEFATAPGGLADWINGLDRIEASALRHMTEQRVTDFRDTWPALPSRAHLRMEATLRQTFLDGRVILQGTPDMALGDVRDEYCRILLVDLKTGHRNPLSERQDLRFYALLATLKYGLPPFRWATYYTREGDWDVEELDADLLHGAVRRVLDAARTAAHLSFDPPEEADLALTPGSWCRFCGRRQDCPAAPDDL